MQIQVTVVFTILLLAAVWLTASMAVESPGHVGLWIAGIAVFLALTVCAVVSLQVAAWSVSVSVAILRIARWFRDQDELGPRASLFYRLM